MKKWWENQPLIISAVQCKYEDDDFYTLNEYVSQSGFNTEQNLHISAQGHMAYYDESLHGKKLDEYLAASRRLGIRQIIYYNTHCLTPDIIKKHPDWQQRTREGGIIPAYNIYALNCINGGWFEDFARNIADLCRHDIDGIFLDGPVMREEGCYCEACQERFRQRFGKPIREATRIEMQSFRVDSVTEFIQKTNEIVKGINPEILLYLNNSALRADITGNNSRRVEPYVDMLGAEGGFIRADSTTSLWSVSSKAKHLETVAGGKPTVTFIAGNQSGMAYQMHTAAETTILYAQSYANGANVWYGLHGSASRFKDSPGSRAATEFNRFVSSHRDVYASSRSAAKIALMWSQETANNYSSSVEQSDFTDAKAAGYSHRGDHLVELMSFFDILTRAHLQFDIIDEVTLAEGIDQYEWVILPDCACLSDESARALTQYVKKGGNLLSTFDTGFYHPDGSPAEMPKLAQIQGIQRAVETVKAEIPGMCYQMLGDSSFFDGLYGDLIPAPRLAVRCQPLPKAEVLSTALEPMASCYAPLPQTGYPGILRTKVGKGQSIYCSGAFGLAYSERAFPEFARIITNMGKELSSPLFTTNAPESVETVLRRQDDRYILHLINLTGEMIRPIRQILPLENLRFTFPKGMVQAPYALRGGRLETVENPDGTLTVTLSRLTDYEVLILPMAD